MTCLERDLVCCCFRVSLPQSRLELRDVWSFANLCSPGKERRPAKLSEEWDSRWSQIAEQVRARVDPRRSCGIASAKAPSRSVRSRSKRRRGDRGSTSAQVSPEPLRYVFMAVGREPFLSVIAESVAAKGAEWGGRFSVEEALQTTASGIAAEGTEGAAAVTRTSQITAGRRTLLALGESCLEMPPRENWQDDCGVPYAFGIRSPTGKPPVLRLVEGHAHDAWNWRRLDGTHLAVPDGDQTVLVAWVGEDKDERRHVTVIPDATVGDSPASS